MKEGRRGTRPDTRLPKSRAGVQGPYLRSLDHLGRSSEAKDRKNQKKVKCDGPTDQRDKKCDWSGDFVVSFAEHLIKIDDEISFCKLFSFFPNKFAYSPAEICLL